MITNKKPIDYLCEILKPLEIPIYKEIMEEDIDSASDSYILVRTDITDNTKIYGGGKSIVRNSNCDIILVSKGTASNSDDVHMVNKNLIAARLKEVSLPYQGFNLGYDSENIITQYTFNTTVSYYG
jgi:hypothetical protein